MGNSAKDSLQQALILSADRTCSNWLREAINNLEEGKDQLAIANIKLVEGRARNPNLLDLLTKAVDSLSEADPPEEPEEVEVVEEEALEADSSDFDDSIDVVIEDSEPEELDLSGLKAPDHDEQA